MKRYSAVTMLLEHGASVSFRNHVTALMCALQCRVGKDYQGRLKVQLSYEFAEVDIVKLLLAYGA